MTEQQIEKFVQELAVESTAPDKECPTWMESDIRRGMIRGIVERDAELLAKIEEMRMRWELKYQEHNSSLGPDHEGLWYSGALYALDSMQSFLTQSKEKTI